MEPKRLYRSLIDRKIAGVAGGLAEYFDTDPLLLRLAFVILAFAIVFLSIMIRADLMYIVFAMQITLI